MNLSLLAYTSCEHPNPPCHVQCCLAIEFPTGQQCWPFLPLHIGCTLIIPTNEDTTCTDTLLQLPSNYTWKDLKDLVRNKAEHGIRADVVKQASPSGHEVTTGWAKVTRRTEALRLYGTLSDDVFHISFRAADHRASSRLAGVRTDGGSAAHGPHLGHERVAAQVHG